MSSNNYSGEPSIIFFGNECLATGISTTTPTIRGLVKAGFNVSAVIINNKVARSRNSQNPEIAKTVDELHIPLISNPSSDELKDLITKLSPTIGVLVAYGQIIPQGVIDLFPCGIINIHPSLLPKHRGPTPIESVILSGEEQTGVSIMKLSGEMDAGPIYAQRTIPVPDKITKQRLADNLLSLGSESLINLLPSILNNKTKPDIQENLAATYDNKIHKKDGLIDWNKSAKQIEREVRAYANWPKSTTVIDNHQVIIINADVENTTGTPGQYLATNQDLLIYCGQQALKIKMLQPAGKKEMTITAFLSGYRV